jgi:DNA adenine methylase
MSRISSPIKYFGGKGNMLKDLYSFFPKEYNVFIEPFCGSAVVTLNQKNEKCIEIINDIDGNVYSLYKTLQDPTFFVEFKKKCDLTCYHEDLRVEAKLKLKEDLDIIDRAYYFFVYNRMSFNGVGGFSVNKVIRRNMSKSVSDMLSTIDGLYNMHQRLSKVIVLKQDALKVIENNNFKNTFIYCDPPYSWDTRTSTRYKNDFTPQQQEELLNLIIQSKSNILLSGYDNPLYERILVKENAWNKYDFVVNTIDGTRNHTPKKKTESLWCNYDIE